MRSRAAARPSLLNHGATATTSSIIDPTSSLRGGADRIRTGGQGFADPCLTTWLRRPNAGRRRAEDQRSGEPLRRVTQPLVCVVPRMRFELIRLAAPPPQDGVSAY